MIGTLVNGRIAFFVRLDDVILKFSHGFEFKASGLCESSSRFDQSLFRRRRKGLSIFVKIRTKQAKCRDFGKGIYKSSGETRHYIEIATASFNEAEKTRTIDTLSTSEDSVQISVVSDDKVECFQATISSRIEEIDHSDAILGNKA